MIRLTLLATSAVLSIQIYRRYVSPHKGYCCAYRATTGRSSCSHFAQRAIRRVGMLRAVTLIVRRFERCAKAAATVAAAEPKPEGVTPFGRCEPAVQEFRKLCCGNLLGGILEGED